MENIDKKTKKINFYNTPARKKQLFNPIESGEVGIYTCGPTVYNYAHIGNLRTYIFEDILIRALLFAGYKVNRVMNITDVGHLISDGDHGEDKMEKGAKREGKSVWDIAEHYTQAFIKDIEMLNILPPDIYCKATDHIEEQIKLVQVLLDKNFAYKIQDGIYFDISKFPSYGEFAGLDLDGLKEGIRVEKVEGKRHPSDFALWKFSQVPGQRLMEWDSPWGTGFPGWHIECSAMGMKYLGETFDIHCGGIDHVPVHHTNEVAQMEAATGKKAVNYWLHGEFLQMAQDKMSKSSGNFITLKTLIDRGFDPMDYRFFLLMAHYRSKLSFSWSALEGAKTARIRLNDRLVAIYNEVMARGLGKPETGEEMANLDGKSGAYFAGNQPKTGEEMASPEGERRANFAGNQPKTGDNTEGSEGEKGAEYGTKESKTDKEINNDQALAEKFLVDFEIAILDDLNTPKCVALLQELIKEERISPEKRYELAIHFDEILGIKLEENIKKAHSGGQKNDQMSPEMAQLVEKRNKAREAKDFKLADEIKGQIMEKGFILQDSKEGTRLIPIG